MNTLAFVEGLGTLVVQSADKDIDEVHSLVQRDRTATHCSLISAYAWACLFGLGDASPHPEAIRWMVTRVLCRLREITGLEFEYVDRLLRNRIAGFTLAAASDDPVINITNYLNACSAKVEATVDYNELMPDLDELEQMGDCDPGALARLKALKKQHNPPTYRMGSRPLEQLSVGAHVLGLAKSVSDHLAMLRCA